MRQLIAAFFSLTLAASPTLILAADVTQLGFSANSDFDLTTRDDGLVLQWNAPEGRAYIDLQFIPRRGNSAAAPLIRELGINGESIIEEVDPNYLFWIGDRDLELRDGWAKLFVR